MEQIIDVREVGKLLVRKRRIIIGTTAFCMVLGGAYLLFTPSTYQSVAMLKFKQPQGLNGSILSNAAGLSGTSTRQLMNTDAEILKSRNVVQPIIDAIEGPQDKGYGKLYDDYVNNRIETKPYKETDLMQVSVLGNSPEQAQEANRLLIDTFLARLADLSHEEQRTTREFLEKRVDAAKKDLDQAEKNLQAFQVEHKVYSTGDQMRGLTDKITLIDREKAQNQLDLETAQSALGVINSQLNSDARSVADSATVQSYKSQLAELESRKATYVGKYTDEHPAMKEINQQIKEAQAGLNNEIESIVAQQAPSSNSAQQGLLTDKFKNEAMLAVAQGKNAVLADLDKQNEEAIMNLPEKERGYIQAKRNVDVAQEIHDMLFKRLEEAKVAEIMVPNEVQIVDAPTLPEKAIAPRTVLTMAVSVILGIILGSLYVLIGSLWNRKILGVKDIESALGIPVIGVIPGQEDSGRSAESVKGGFWKKWKE